QDLEIIKLKTRVKKLERANKVKAFKLRRLRKVGISQRVDTSDDTIMEDEAIEVVTTAKLITEVVAAVSEIVSVAAVVPTVTAAPVKVAVPSTRHDTAAYGEVPTVSQELSIPSPTTPTPPPQPPHDLPSTSQVHHTPPQSPQRVDTLEDTVMDDASNQGRIIDEMDKDNVVSLMDDKEEDKKDEEAKEDEPTEVQEVVDVVTTAKLITEVVTVASTIISAAEP
nr:hypothetical protein [Tanacetum cinerariifolium]